MFSFSAYTVGGRFEGPLCIFVGNFLYVSILKSKVIFSFLLSIWTEERERKGKWGKAYVWSHVFLYTAGSSEEVMPR